MTESDTPECHWTEQFTTESDTPECHGLNSSQQIYPRQPTENKNASATSFPDPDWNLVDQFYFLRHY